MKLLILGATGNMGQRLLAQGLARGHAITAFVRNRAKLQQQLGTAVPPGLAVFEGDDDDDDSDDDDDDSDDDAVADEDDGIIRRV